MRHWKANAGTADPGDDTQIERRPAAFFTVSDDQHFLGAVALLNSLRLVGHDEPFVLVDCGLAPWQRDVMAPHATLVTAPRGVPPMLLKALGPLACPAFAMAILDADVIVTRSLRPLLDEAADGKVLAFANVDDDRYFPEWGDLLGLRAPRRQTYVASGHLFVAGERGLELLRIFDAAQRRLDHSHTLLANSELRMSVTPEAPLYYPDMDALNAVLASEVVPEELVVVDYELAPHAPFEGVQLVDRQTLRCRYDDGVEPFLLHHPFCKPWLKPTRRNIYSHLLSRLLVGEDLPLRVDPSHVPLRLRHGRLAAVDRTRADVQSLVRSRVRGRLGIRPRVAAWRRAAFS